jgi:hypothetical protein
LKEVAHGHGGRSGWGWMKRARKDGLMLKTVKSAI